MLGFLQERERFIPVHVPTLLERILADTRLSAQERQQLAAVAQMLQARIHFEFLEEGERVKALYDPFNPDRDTLPLHPRPESAPTYPWGATGWADSAKQSDRSFESSPPLPAAACQDPDAQFRQLREGIEFFLNKSNYTKLTPEQLAACMQSKSRWGLAVKIDPSQYQEIDVYYRGVRQEMRTECSWRTLWRPLEVPVWVFARVAVLVRQTGRQYGDRVLLKLFKDVVIEDLKMTWPNLRILMRPMDRLMLAVSAVGGIFAPLWKLLVAVTLSPYVVATVVFGCLSAMVRAIWNFISCKDKYVKTLTHNLYYQNLANNLSALARLIDTAEAEEVKEALLAYYLLYTERDQDYTAEQLDRRIERWLAEEFSLPRVDFEIEDALGKLAAKELAVGRPADGQAASPAPASFCQPSAPATLEAAEGRQSTLTGQKPMIWKVYDLPSALRRLDRWWDQRFPYHVPSASEPMDRLADAHWPPRQLECQAR
ncbi:MAG: TMEM143 family protein [Thermoguttaceae bacterium]|nr:TMEM143 family protein [Thermoguttaceae bacterium]MDW8039290.1 DUF3754 domain-containing protein [Thermoguttaceae bacterium]